MYHTSALLLRLTVRQVEALRRLLDGQRHLYNAALEERRGAWRWEQRTVSRREQYAELAGWDDPVLAFGATVARGTLLRLDRAFISFYRRAKAGAKPGYPRFRSAARWDSVEYPQSQSWKITGSGQSGRLYIQGVGQVAYRCSARGVVGVPKTLVIKREGRRYRAYVTCQVQRPEPLPATGKQLGIDLGITALVATSEGDLIDNDRQLARNRERLARAQRLVSGRRRGSARRRKAAERVGAAHRRIARARRNAHHRLSRCLVERYDVIVHEELKVADMVRRPRPVPDGTGGFAPNGAAAKAGLNREIHSAGWGVLLRMIAYKAEGAGRQVIAVDPRHTSQRCHSCGSVDAGNRTGAVFRCTACGHTDHADVNAARNILRAGLALRLERAA